MTVGLPKTLRWTFCTLLAAWLLSGPCPAIADNGGLADRHLLGRVDAPAGSGQASLPSASTRPNEGERPRSPLHTFSTTQLWIIVGVMAFFTLDLLFVLFRHRRTEAALKESEAQTRLLLNSAAEGIYGLDLHGRCTFLNPAGLSMLGYQNEDSLVGQDLHALIHHTRKDGTHYPAEDCKICHAYQQNSRIHLEDEVFWRKDGSSFPVEYWSYPLYRGSRIVGAVVSFLDITERKEAERKLQEANRELDAFVSTASHDLRTPLSVISGYVDLLDEEYGSRLEVDGRKYLDTIKGHSSRMAGLIDDLLALARAGSVPSPVTPIAATEVVDDVLHRYRDQLQARDIRIDLQPLPEVRVPESLLAEVFANLIENALHYGTDRGGAIEIGGEERNGRTLFWVRDHGQGIPPKEAERIFQAFYRGSTSLSTNGSGVGLATVQKIARLYGGRAWVEETSGGGATFRVEINNQADAS